MNNLINEIKREERREETVKEGFEREIRVNSEEIYSANGIDGEGRRRRLERRSPCESGEGKVPDSDLARRMISSGVIGCLRAARRVFPFLYVLVLAGRCSNFRFYMIAMVRLTIESEITGSYRIESEKMMVAMTAQS